MKVWVFTQHVGYDGETDVVGVVATLEEAERVQLKVPALQCQEFEVGRVMFDDEQIYP